MNAVGMVFSFCCACCSSDERPEPSCKWYTLHQAIILYTGGILIPAISGLMMHPSADALQVMEFGSDPVLWQLDTWLLADVSDRHLPFADAYMAHLLKSLVEATQAELDRGPHLSPGGSKSGRVEHLKGRLRDLSCKSPRLNALCRKALAQIRFIDL